MQISRLNTNELFMDRDGLWQVLGFERGDLLALQIARFNGEGVLILRLPKTKLERRGAFTKYNGCNDVVKGPDGIYHIVGNSLESPGKPQ